MTTDRGWASGDDPRRGQGDAASIENSSSPSRFTPINERNSSPLLSSSTTHQSSTTRPRKKRNSAVARYLGLGSETEPAHLANYTSQAPNILPVATSREIRRKRPRKVQDDEKAGLVPDRAPKQRRISDGFPISKPAVRQSLTYKYGEGNTLPDSSQTAASNFSGPLAALSDVTVQQQNRSRSIDTLISSATLASAPSIRTQSYDTTPGRTSNEVVAMDVSSRSRRHLAMAGESSMVTRASKNSFQRPPERGLYSYPIARRDSSSFNRYRDDPVSLAKSSSFNDGNPPSVEDFDDGIDDILGAIDLEHLTNTEWPNDGLPGRHPSHNDVFNDGLDDDDLRDLLLLTSDPNEDSNSTQSYGHDQAHSHKKDLSSASKENVPPLKAAATATSFRSQYVSPFIRNQRVDIGEENRSDAEVRKPIIRPPFPSPVRDRSPIVGLSSDTRLRTCFRIGEAINTGHLALRHGENILLELYAKVHSSERDDLKQHFVFRDLFHSKPPFLKATYDAAIWMSVELYNYDSGRLLQDGRMCRCIGKMKREGNGYVLTVLNIWETTWDDISWVEGIINP